MNIWLATARILAVRAVAVDVRIFAARVLVVAGFGGWLLIQSLTAGAGQHKVALLVLEDTIDPVSARLIERAIEDSENDGAHLLIVQLNTPGGLMQSTRDIVNALFEANLPVVVYVSPSGAQAASAGTFVAAGAHIAAMAPATNIGAASPVRADGEDLPDTIKSKATQDAAAFLRSIAAQRGRNAEALQSTVLDAASYTAEEALELGIIDIYASDVQSLLDQMHGLTVPMNDGGSVTLDTDDIAIAPIEMTLVERFIGVIANPNIAFVLLVIGGIGVIIELLSPGLLGPGAVGVIALALAFLAFGSLPVNWVGVGLIVLGMVLFYIEAQAPGIGIFGVSGAVSFIVGAFLLFGNFTFIASPPPLPDAPNFNLSPWIIGGVTVLLLASMVFTLRAVRQAKGMSSYNTHQRGTASLIGSVGVAVSDIDPSGSVQVAGERWSAVSADGTPIASGEDVIVSEIEGLTLKVFRG